MKWLWIAIVILTTWMFLGVADAVSPIHPRHDDSKKVDDEINNIFDGFQPRQFRTFTTTPALSDLQDGEFAIFNSTAVKIIWRSGNDIYAINGSCITVSR